MGRAAVEPIKCSTRGLVRSDEIPFVFMIPSALLAAKNLSLLASAATMNAMPSEDTQSPAQIANVPQEVTGQARRVVVGRVTWRDTFAALKHRNFRLFFVGQLVSLIGSWMQ